MEKWYCYRHPKTHQEVRITATPGNQQRLKRLGFRLKGYKLMAVVDPVTVNKGAK